LGQWAVASMRDSASEMPQKAFAVSGRAEIKFFHPHPIGSCK
jgi:hypothetical protein